MKPDDPSGEAAEESANIPDSGPAEASAVERKNFWDQTFSSLKHRDYRLLWGGTIFSSSGRWIQQVSLGWLAYVLTQSPLILGVVNGVLALPMLLLGPLGGVITDRVDRRLLMLWTQVWLMVTAFIFATMVAGQWVQLWSLYLFTFLMGAGWAFNQPVRQSLVPNVVPRKDLMNAVALNSAGFNITRIVGPALGGLLIAWITIAGNFYLQGLAYLGVAVMIYMMHVPPNPRAAREEHLTTNLWDGIRYVWAHKPILMQVMLALVPVLMAFPYISLMPIFAEDIYGVGAAGLGLLMAVPGIGAVIATLAMASFGEFKHHGTILCLSIIVQGVGLVAFALAGNFVLALAFLVVVGGAQMSFMVTNNTLLQILTPDEFRGRVMGLYMLNQGLMPLGSLFAGIVAEGVGAPLAVAIMGGACATLGFLALASPYGRVKAS